MEQMETSVEPCYLGLDYLKLKSFFLVYTFSVTYYMYWLCMNTPYLQYKNLIIRESKRVFYFLLYRHSGHGVKQYRYYDPETCGFDFKGCLEDIAVS